LTSLSNPAANSAALFSTQRQSARRARSGAAYDGVDHGSVEGAVDHQRLGNAEHHRAMEERPSSRWDSVVRSLHFDRRSVLNPMTLIKEGTMTKMTKSQLIDAISESSAVSKSDVRAVIENMATVGYKELNESGEFVIPGFVKMTVVNKPATEARSGVNPFTKEPMEFAAKPASKTVKASPLKVAKDAV
jgi:DNA-binding protein HU-beta